MKRLVACAALTGAALLPLGSPASGGVDRDCGSWDDINATFTTAYTSCWNIQAENLKQRVRARIVRRSDGWDRYVYGPWKDCNGAASGVTFNNDNNLYVSSSWRIAPDDIAGGC